jgi:hypothetical protein
MASRAQTPPVPEPSSRSRARGQPRKEREERAVLSKQQTAMYQNITIGARVVLRLKKVGRKKGPNLFTGNLANGTVRFIGTVEGEVASAAEDMVQYGIELDQVRANTTHMII